MIDRVLGIWLVVAAVAAVAFGAEPGIAELENELGTARRSYDVESATRVLAEARVASAKGDESERLARLRVQAGLLLAELLRIEYERTPESERAERRALGQRIDAAAEEALGLIDGLPESSERYRMEADLLATMIRSDFRAQKYRDRLELAIERSLELDPENARAWVTSTKPLIFADPEQGGDLDEAIDRLDRALELAPALEPALLLRALAHERDGNARAAAADWRAALAGNPLCEPAERALEGP